MSRNAAAARTGVRVFTQGRGVGIRVEDLSEASEKGAGTLGVDDVVATAG
jgi:hypothetical protein